MNEQHTPGIEFSDDDRLVLGRLAKFVGLNCVRNTELENLHAGIYPSSKTGDYTDVFVRTPYGDIPWNDLSRFYDDEMKTLMIDVNNHLHRFFFNWFFQRGFRARLLNHLSIADPCERWDMPQLLAPQDEALVRTHENFLYGTWGGKMRRVRTRRNAPRTKAGAATRVAKRSR